MTRPQLLFLAAMLVGACGETSAAPLPAPQAVSPDPEHSDMPAMAPTDVKRLDGTVAEVLDAGRYTYVRLDTEVGSRWAVSMGELDLELGEAAAFDIHYQQEGFHSRILDREFDRLFFGQLADA